MCYSCSHISDRIRKLKSTGNAAAADIDTGITDAAAKTLAAHKLAAILEIE
jgi:hypothetical protein